jgi:uncharacterized protein
MGGVLKYLVVLLVVGVAIWFWVARSRIGRSGRDKRAPGENAGSGTGRAVASPAEMVACAHCGLHLPAADALQAGGRHYCSAAHRVLGPATH